MHIALVCPGGPITHELAQGVRARAALLPSDKENLQLHFHPQCFFSAGHFAGTDAERSAAFLEVANDPKYDAVWFARGGYGACRLDENIFSELNDIARSKIYLGYSDAGVLLGRLYKEKIGRPVHGPMPADLPRENGAAAIDRALHYLLFRTNNTVEPNLNDDIPVAAFNITVLAHLVATDWAPDLSGHVVLLEDVSEYHYRIDRAMFAIMKARPLQQVAGVKLGRVSDVPKNDRPFGETEEEIVERWCAEAGVPYLGRADIGHDADNKIVPFGRLISLTS